MAAYSGAYEFSGTTEQDQQESRAASQLPRPPLLPPSQQASRTHPTRPPPAPPPARHPLLYVRSPLLERLSQHAHVNQDRPALVHSLIEACGLLEAADVVEPAPATVEQLREFHSLEFLTALATVSRLPEEQLQRLSPRQLAALAAFGLQDDCAPFPGVFPHAALAAGGSLAAAAALCARTHHVAVHLDGGRHHAHKSRAAGFCYTNDVVLAILRLLSTFSHIVYIDLDIHHCDAVEEAFALTSRVCTISLHKCAPGFFPGSGQLSSLGAGPGRGFSLNLPLKDGLRDGLLVEAFGLLAGGAVAAFQPDCVVLQCGVDGLAHDPVVGAGWGLTPQAYADCAQQAASWGLPLLVLGGGGYSSPAAARAWASLMAALQVVELPRDIPEHEFFDRHGPSFCFADSKPLLAPESNDRAAVLAGCSSLLAELRKGLGAAVPRHGAAKRARA